MPLVPQIGISGRGELKVEEGRCDGSVDLVHCENPKIIKEWFDLMQSIKHWLHF